MSNKNYSLIHEMIYKLWNGCAGA
ncbi:hypothetical protein C5167_010854 [Papaver somniferum]|uniref:Uncharacterized protein n=1 Tax=Papaver somniferum TaxID=3469 RepID=A0A4Y7K590_PAPSO|nr:hypothetical protein C5167_010854 [Papaver somniferum]